MDSLKLYFSLRQTETSSRGTGSPQGGLMVLAPLRGIAFTIKIVNFNRERNTSRRCKNHQATLRATRPARRRFPKLGNKKITFIKTL